MKPRFPAPKMTATPDTLRQPVTTATEDLATGLLRKAAKANQRLQASADPEALHDFRVTVRRLRTYLEAYGPVFGNGQAERLQRKLASFIDATNANRDHEVHFAIVEGQLARRSLPKLQREGFQIVREELSYEGEPAPPESLDAVIGQFTKLEQKLQKRRWNPTGARPARDVPRAHHSFAAATRDIVWELAESLRAQLVAIQGVDDQRPAHRARLTVKRLRYVVEPLQSATPAAKPVVEELKLMQDEFGGLRDLQNLEKRIARITRERARQWCIHLIDLAVTADRLSALTKEAPEVRECYALAAALQAVRKQEHRTFARVHRRWVAGAAGGLFRRLERLSHHLTPKPPR